MVIQYGLYVLELGYTRSNFILFNVIYELSPTYYQKEYHMHCKRSISSCSLDVDNLSSPFVVPMTFYFF